MNVIYYLTVQFKFLASGRGVERRGGRSKGRKGERKGWGKRGRERGRDGGREREEGRKEGKNRDKEVRTEGSRQKNRQCSALEEIYGLWKATSPNGWIFVLSLQCPCSQHSSHSNHCVLVSGMKTWLNCERCSLHWMKKLCALCWRRATGGSTRLSPTSYRWLSDNLPVTRFINAELLQIAIVCAYTVCVVHVHNACTIPSITMQRLTKFDHIQ